MMGKLLEFKNIPLSNSLLSDRNQDIKYYDLKIGFDEETKLVSLINNATPEELFPDDYVYDSSQSNTMVEHFKMASLSLQNRFNHVNVLEIGSNSGIFIRHFNPDTAFAVEPCSNFADITNDMEYKTYDKFWDNKLSKLVKQNHGTMDLIFSANTVSHVQNLDEFLGSVCDCLNDDGIFIIECPSFLELLKGNAFDQFYHEHQSYFSCISFKNMIERNGFKLFDIETYPVHGGTYRFFICKQSLDIQYSNNIDLIMKEEKDFGVDNYDVLISRMNIMKQNMSNIKETLLNLKRDGNVIVGYGATAKFTQVSNMCELNSEVIDYALDTTPDKQNKYIPKSKIKIVSYNNNSLDGVDYCFLGAWNYRDEILKKEEKFIKNGGKFITHIPKVKIIP